jgi:carboxymethylenebutenolidase
LRRNRSNSVFGLGASGGDSDSRLGASDGSGAIVRGAACRFRCARIAAFISSRCDWSAIAGTSTAPGCRLLPYPPAVCFEVDSEPPIPAISGAAVSHDDLVLVAADGNRFAAFLASPDEPAATGIVILPDVRGLYRFYEELALRFAERGFAAIAFDYFGRTAGVAKRDADFEYAEHVQATKPDTVQADVAAAAGRLRELGCTSIFTVGFCFGGRNSWLAAAAGHGLRGVVGFYGMPGERNGAPGPTQRAAELEAPILALQAGDDGNITAEHNAAFEAALAAAGVEHEVVTYARAPHSFFDRKQEDFADASEDAWRRVLDFLERHG